MHKGFSIRQSFRWYVEGALVPPLSCKVSTFGTSGHVGEPFGPEVGQAFEVTCPLPEDLYDALLLMESWELGELGAA